MSLVDLITALGTTAIAQLISAFIKPEVQSDLFYYISPRSLGHDCSVFIKNSIFFVAGKRLLHWKPLITSTILFICFGILFTYCGARYTNIKFTEYVSLLLHVITPFSFTNLLVASFCVFLLLLSDYLSFVQTFLLMKYASETRSFWYTTFIAYADIILTLSTSIFIGALMLMLVYSSLILHPFGYASYLVPDPFPFSLRASGLPSGSPASGSMLQILFLIDPNPIVSGDATDDIKPSDLRTAFNEYSSSMTALLKGIATGPSCRNYISDIDRPRPNALLTFMAIPTFYGAYKSSSSTSAISLLTQHFDFRRDYFYPNREYTAPLGDGLLIFTVVRPRSFLSIRDIVGHFSILYTASFTLMQEFQWGIFNPRTYFAPMPLTTDSWCNLSDYLIIGRYDPITQKFDEVHAGWSNASGAPDWGGKVATSIVLDKLINLLMSDAAKRNNAKYNFTYCDGKVTYQSDDDVKNTMKDCNESIAWLAPEVSNIAMGRLAQFALLSRSTILI